jgi:RNAse (barnase) inhibitor barstar
MRIIELDGRSWRTAVDFYEAILAALEAPDWHGRNINALFDSMIWGGINGVEPPYTVRISGTAGLPQRVQEELEAVCNSIGEQRDQFRAQKGRDVDAYIEVT